MASISFREISNLLKIHGDVVHKVVHNFRAWVRKLPEFAFELKSAMNEKKRNHSTANQPIQHPAYPYRADQILEKLRGVLQNHLRRRMTFDQLGRLSAQPLTTAHYRWIQSLGPRLIVLMSLLEQLPASDRDAFMSSFCRPLPSLQHPRLAHSLENTSALLDALRQPNGLTVLRGGSEFERTFVLTAIGHDFARFDPQHRLVAGLDLHRPIDVVPIQTLIYLDILDEGEMRASVGRIWPDFENSRSPLILLNRVWSKIPEMRPRIADWARHRHVVVAEKNGGIRDYLLVPKKSLRFLFLSSDKAFPARIHIRPESFD
jgi:hypothetical protein